MRCGHQMNSKEYFWYCSLSLQCPPCFCLIMILIKMLDNDKNSLRPEEIMNWHNAFQPVVEKIQSQYPGYAIGISSPLFNGLVALSPNFTVDKMGKGITPNDKSTYETGNYCFMSINSSISWTGDDVIGVTYPVFYKGEVIAHTFLPYSSFGVAFLRLSGLSIINLKKR
ncbi:MAG: hypothetical protein K0Q75_2851 [Anaerospora sp.]|nr:hypothetical protein [Anaerospora sp.]